MGSPQAVPEKEGTRMPKFLVEVAYTPEAWAAQLEHPQNRAEVLKPCLETVGARFESFYFAFGEYDVVGIMDCPDNVSAAALSLAFSSGGSIKAIRTTPLMTVEEGLEALQKGARVRATYTPPARQMAGAARN
jgi:uncharacterized protein with GYD domain